MSDIGTADIQDQIDVRPLLCCQKDNNTGIIGYSVPWADGPSKCYSIFHSVTLSVITYSIALHNSI